MMKRRQAFVVLIMVLVLFAAGRARAAEVVGWVAALEGTAERLRGGSWSALASGAELELGDHVRTSAGSRVKLLFRDDSVLTLAEGSELAIDEQVAGAAPVSTFSLVLGQVRAIVTDRYGATGSRFEMKSPTAIAGVRGTSFFAGYDGAKDETLVLGLESTTVVRALGAKAREVRLGPGQATTIRRGAAPTQPRRLPESVVRSLTAATSTRERGADATSGGVPDPRSPTRPGERARSPEEREVDQGVKFRRRVSPPPPPVP
jgi:hypothetical protein